MTRKEIEEAKVLTKFRVGACIRLIKHPECRSVVLAIEDGFYKCNNDTIPIKDSYKWEMYAEIKEEADIIAMQERRWLIKPPSTRKEQIEQASVEYQIQKKPVAIAGAEWTDLAYRMNINKDFCKGAEWADENPDERMIAKYLYEKKGYPIDLNGNLPSFEETMKDVEKYNKYKEDKLIDRAAEWLAEQKEIIGVSFTEDFFERFHEAMEK